MLRTTFFIAVLASLLALLVMMVILPGGPERQPNRDEPSGSGAGSNSFAIENARVFDGERLRENITLVVRDGMISAMEEGAAIPDGLRRVEAGGRTVLPGLIDAHTHTIPGSRADSLRFGIAATLDMFTVTQNLEGMRDQRASLDETAQADLYSAGMLATAEGGHGTQFGVPVETLSGPEEAEDWVARRVAEGSDYIKLVYIPGQSWAPSIDRATARAVIEAAHARGLMALAHISTLDAARDMLEDGIDGLVHIFADRRVDEPFIEEALRREVFIVPTLAVIASVAGERLALEPEVEEMLSPGQKQLLSSPFAVELPGYDLDIAMENVRRLHDAGVPILAGSDAPNPGVAPGIGLHLEMRLLARAGLRPADILRAATSTPASVFGLKARGQLKAGSRADLILVQGDPLTDIRASARIRHVFKNGYSVDRTPAGRGGDTERVPAVIGTFDTDLTAKPGFIWAATDDESFGGASGASISHVAEGADDTGGAMAVTAQVRPGFMVPWAGAYFGPQQSDRVRFDLKGYDRLVFQVRGTPGAYRVLLFNSLGAGVPPTVTFRVTPSWQTVILPLDEFPGYSREAFAGMAIVAGPAPGDYRFEIDTVRFEE